MWVLGICLLLTHSLLSFVHLPCRAEMSLTYRHLCEFMGLDFEMTIHDHYFEVLDVIEKVFQFIFEGLATTCGACGSASHSQPALSHGPECCDHLKQAQSNWMCFTTQL